MSRSTVGEASLGEIQAIVDDLSETLHRSVAVDNSQLELLAASAQHGAIDRWRVDAIITRRPPQDPLAWLLGHHIHTSHRPVRLPRNNDLQLLPRVCFPIRSGGALLGYLWLVDEPHVTAEEMEIALGTVGDLVRVMASDDQALLQRADLMQRLTNAAIKSATAPNAIQRAIQLGYLNDDKSHVVYVFGLRTRQASLSSGTASTAKDLRLELARRQVRRSFLADVDGGRLIAIANHGSARHADDVTTLLRRSIDVADYEIRAAGSAMSVMPIDLGIACAHAEFAAELSSLKADQSTMLRWESLDSWRLLFGRPLDSRSIAELSPEAALLVGQGSAEHWRTALAYLDSGRRVAPTCESLRIHRGTLYYRLDRVRDLLGFDALDDGWRATSLHVALKLHKCLTESGAGLP